ncbi:glycosyltransferase family 4 protein [Halobaculum gomorrense]|uniref:Glycosyltransferase involved in cell wall bisynthesis n=1 Tax=Halobaculum gomorrense TaxID=43928 RepID=A0A1M5UZR0_9EURY|nr:glycosyltransferase family 4 protein [Halobaculum gomorrense]SHH68338.1 Glycosyltransferase involved in cell wall bisynthesis [Halobaculum gomorrense]
MNVLALTDYLGNVGGAELSAREILVGLAAHEEITSVTAVGGDLPGVDRLDFPGVDLAPVEISRYQENIPDLVSDSVLGRRLARTARQYVDDADVIHAHHQRSAFALTHLNTSTPTVATVRDFWPICPISIYSVNGRQCRGCDADLNACLQNQGWDGPESPAVKAYLRLKRRHNRGVLTEFDANIFIADHIRKTVSQSSAVADETNVIHNPVEVTFEGNPITTDHPRFVTASSLVDQKGIDVAIRAVGHLDEFQNAELVIFGDGPQRSSLESLAASVAPGQVDFRGRVDLQEVYQAMAGATATIFPSTWEEPFGRVTVESMSLGTPVVGSAVGGISEVIDDNKTGLLFPPGDDAVLADHLESLCKETEFAASLGQRAREASKRFTRESVASQHYSFYNSLVR